MIKILMGIQILLYILCF